MNIFLLSLFHSLSLTRRTKIPHLKKESKNIILFLNLEEKPRVSRGRKERKKN